MSDTKPCPICGEDIKRAAVKCRFCGEDLARYAKQQEIAVERTLYTGGVPMFYSVGQVVGMVCLFVLFILPGLIYLLSRVYEQAANKYVITTQRIGVQTGWLSKGGENIELFRVDDFGLNTPFGMKLMGYGWLIFRSSDRTAGALQIVVPIDQQNALADQIREAIFDQRENRKVMTLARS